MHKYSKFIRMYIEEIKISSELENQTILCESESTRSLTSTKSLGSSGSQGSLTNACFICLDNESPVVRLCQCRGTNKGVHRQCLNDWIELSGKNNCLVCQYKYTYVLLFRPTCSDILKQFYFDVYVSSNWDTILVSIIATLILKLMVFVIIHYFLPVYECSLLLWLFLLIQLSVLIVLKKIDTDINLIVYLKYFQLFFGLIFYIYIIFKSYFEYNTCSERCSKFNAKCNPECSLYTNYTKKNTDNLDCVVHQSLILLTIIFIDVGQKITRGSYKLLLKEVAPT